jgi:hypothetical protein
MKVCVPKKELGKEIMIGSVHFQGIFGRQQA